MRAPIRPEVAESMREVGRKIASAMPDTHVFLLIMADIGEGGHTSYLSNGDRQDMLKLLKEFIVKMEEESV